MFGRPHQRALNDIHDKIVDEALAVTDLTDFADRRAGALTAGMLRKLEIARAIATRPSLLLADEPCAGLNPAETEGMLGCLRNVRDMGVTVWLVEHDMKAVTSLCDRVLVIDAGSRIAEGTPAQGDRGPQGDSGVPR